MSSNTLNKEELPKEFQRVLNTLTDDAQNAALRKCRELGYDTNKGKISLEETLRDRKNINVTYHCLG